jgi:pimeloyl-ACP methyl ester carboxylesterase
LTARWGGAVSDFAHRYPERVRALVLVGSAVSGFQGSFEPPGEWDELVAADEAVTSGGGLRARGSNLGQRSRAAS